MTAAAAPAPVLNNTTLTEEFKKMALELHCHHSGRSVTWDDSNVEDWKNCKYSFCRRRYEMLQDDSAVVFFNDRQPIKPATCAAPTYDDNPAPCFGYSSAG